MSYEFHICLDFDGVVHSYESGWKGATTIPDAPVPGAFDAIRAYLVNGMVVNLYSSRSKEDGAIEAMIYWFMEHGASDIVNHVNFHFPKQKPPANITIDDRAFCFEGDFPSPRWIREFIPWNKRVKR